MFTIHQNFEQFEINYEDISIFFYNYYRDRELSENQLDLNLSSGIHSQAFPLENGDAIFAIFLRAAEQRS